MKKIFMLFLVVTCIVISSSAFSAIPEGKFPIQILSSRVNPNSFEKEVIPYLENTFNKSPKYRISNVEENRIVISILINKYFPAVASSDWLASAAPIITYSIVWIAKPKNEHGYYIWHDSGDFRDCDELVQHILKEADVKVWRIKNLCPYVFD